MPQGILLDIHPEPQPVQIELQLGERSLTIGQVDEPESAVKIAAARAALAEVVAAGYFRKQRSLTFERTNHFDSVDSYLAYRAERGCGGSIAEEVIARARALCAAGASELRTRTRVYAARLRRLGPGKTLP